MRVLGCLFKAVVGLVVLVALFVYFCLMRPMWGGVPAAARGGPVPLSPAWALECWVWEDDENTAASTLALLEDYRKNDFPVRTVLIDSPWSTRYNDFTVDEERFPNPAAFFRNLEDRGYRVVLWMTCNVNSKSDDTAIPESSDWHAAAAARGYTVGGDYQADWWKGYGGFIDYTNPHAMQWWRNLQEQVFALGIDGWKLDGAATLLGRTEKFFWPFKRAHQGRITTREYMDHYYRDEYRYGLTRNPEFITLARALDSPTPFAHPEGFAPLDASPVNWVGDNKHRWEDEERGLERALRMILRSAKLGYNVVGSDVAGYHGGGEIAPNLYIRWAQFSTFCGLFLNGGHGERRMSRRTPQELEIIREYSWLHTELVPYMFSYVAACHKGGQPLMRPLEAKYHYLFGDDLLIAPLYQDSPLRAVSLPEDKWRYWFDDAEIIDGPAEFTREFALDEFPVYIREGAIIPMRIEREYTGIGERDWAGYLVWNLYPAEGAERRFELFHPEDNGQTTTVARVTGGNPMRIQFEGAHAPHVLRVLAEGKPASVALDGNALVEGSAWSYDAARKRLIVKTDTTVAGQYEIRF